MLRQFEESQSGQALLEFSVQALPQPPNTGGQETEEATSPSGSGHAMCMLWPNQPVVSRPLPRHRRIQRVDLPPLQHFDRLRWQIPGRRPEVAYVSRANWSIKEKTKATLQTIYDEENQPSAYALYKLAQKAGHASTRKKVDEFVKRQAATQILTAKKAPSRVVGKFQATRRNEKWQMDVLDRSTMPSELDADLRPCHR